MQITKCYTKYNREIHGLIELIEYIFEFALKIKYPWLCIAYRHICAPITIGIYEIIIIIIIYNICIAPYNTIL